MLKSSSSKSKKRSGERAKRNGRTKSAQRAKANSANRTLSTRSNGRTKRGRNTLDDDSLERALQHAIDQKNKKDYAAAIQTLLDILAARPDSVSALFLMGGLWLYARKRPQKAARYFKRATELAPRWERVSLGLFHSLWDMGKDKAAMREIKRFQAIAHCADYDEITAELKEKGLWE